MTAYEPPTPAQPSVVDLPPERVRRALRALASGSPPSTALAVDEALEGWVRDQCALALSETRPSPERARHVVDFALAVLRPSSPVLDARDIEALARADLAEALADVVLNEQGDVLRRP